MKAETIVNQVNRWSDFIGVTPPQVRIVDAINPRMLGSYRKGVITIFVDGMNRGTAKHEFLHYLHDLKGYQSYDVAHFWKATLKLSDLYPDHKLNQEHAVRKMTARSWINIKKWFYDIQPDKRRA